MPFGDEAYSIILNTACSPEKVPEPLKALFEYINDPTKGSGDALVDDIDRQVSRFNTDEWRRRHMTLQELMDRNYEQGLSRAVLRVKLLVWKRAVPRVRPQVKQLLLLN